MLGARGPDFLAVNDVVVAVAQSRCAQAERVGAGRRLGDAERLEAKLAARDRRQVALFLFGTAVAKERAHRVHLGVTGGAVAAAGLDLLHDRGRRGHGQPAAAVLFGNERGEEPGFGQRRDELFRISALAIEAAPIFAGKIRAQRPHRFTDRREVLVAGVLGRVYRHLTLQTCNHSRSSARPLLTAITSRSTTRERKLTIAPSRHISVRSVSPGNTGAENRQAKPTSFFGS